MNKKILLTIIFGMFLISFASATITITPPLNATTVTPTLELGGSLEPNTTYYYRVVALKSGYGGYTGLYSASLWGIPSEEVSITTDDTHKSVSFTWTAVTGTTGYVVYRTTVSGDYDVYDSSGNIQYHLVNPQSSLNGIRYASTTTTSFTDDGTIPIYYAIFLEEGLPMATVSSSSEALPDRASDWYDALISAGFTNHTTRIKDKGYTYKLYNFNCNLWITDGCIQFKDREMILLEGNFIITRSTGVLKLGDIDSGYPSHGATFERKWIYASSSTVGSYKFYDSKFSDIGSVNSQGYGIASTLSLVTGANFDIQNSQFDGGWQFSGSATGKIINSLNEMSSFLQGSGKLYLNKMTFKNSVYIIYAYYAKSTLPNPYIKNAIVQKGTYDILFHKNFGFNYEDAINHQWLNEPPRAKAISNPQLFCVRRKYEYLPTFIDEEGNAIEGVNVTITDGLGNVQTPEVSLLDGSIWHSSGQATATTTNTITDTSKNWATDELTDMIAEIYEGTGSGQEMGIWTNTADTMTLKGDLETTPDTTSKYRIAVHLKTHEYLGKATSPYYDDTNFNPITITATADNYAPYTMILNVTEKMETITTLESRDWNYSNALKWIARNETNSLLKLDEFGNLAIRGNLFENTNSSYINSLDNVAFKIPNFLVLTKNGILYLLGEIREKII